MGSNTKITIVELREDFKAMANRILIVDDAAFMRMMVRDILTKNGFEVVGEAQDGAQAIEKYKERNNFV